MNEKSIASILEDKQKKLEHVLKKSSCNGYHHENATSQNNYLGHEENQGYMLPKRKKF